MSGSHLPYVSFIIVGLSALGCGRGLPPAPEPRASADVLFADNVRSFIEDLESAESPGAVPGLAMAAVENLESYKEAPGAENHLATYEKIYRILDELQKMSSPSKAAVEGKIQELTSLADQLPKGSSSGAPAANTGSPSTGG